MDKNVSFRQRASVLAATIALLLLLPHAAFAHAVLVKSSPGQGATVKAGEVGITLTYNSRIDAQHSSLHLVGPDGKEQALDVDLHAGPNLLVSKTPLPSESSTRARTESPVSPPGGVNRCGSVVHCFHSRGHSFAISRLVRPCQDPW